MRFKDLWVWVLESDIGPDDSIDEPFYRIVAILLIIWFWCLLAFMIWW